MDGSIAFWAVEDSEQPLMVRTLDEVDVHKVDGEKLEQYLPDEEGPAKHPSRLHQPREPIFKLAWSGYPNSYDARGGETSLVVLGGQFAHDTPGVNVLWLPAFNPPAPPCPVTDQSLDPFFRNAMRESLDPLSAYFYGTAGLVQDFLLTPRDSPHFGGTWNPTAILTLFESGEHIRAIEARQFPPLQFLANTQELSQSAEEPKGDSHDSLAQDLATTLQSMTVNEEPKKLYLPPSLWGGADALVEATLFSLDRIEYETLSGASKHGPDHLLLEGGISMPDEEVASEIKYAKVVNDHFLACQSYVAPRAVRTSSYCRYEECRLVTTLFGFICATPYPHTVVSLHLCIPARPSSPLHRCPWPCRITRYRGALSS
jgi:syntaxin-binding protein 5